jgi:hypothetical protein
MPFLEIIESIRRANPERTHENLSRRILKIGEEVGEVDEAYLNVTSAGNGKGKTWNDVREELADVLIVCVDVALTVLPTESDNTTRVSDLGEFVGTQVRSDITASLEDLFLGLQGAVGELAAARAVGSTRTRSRAFSAVVYAFEMARRRLPDQQGRTQQQIDGALLEEVTRKLAKWHNNRQTGRASTDAE